MDSKNIKKYTSIRIFDSEYFIKDESDKDKLNKLIECLLYMSYRFYISPIKNKQSFLSNFFKIISEILLR